MQKILVIYTSHTIGHKKIADNIAYWLKTLGNQVIMHDALDPRKQDSRTQRFLKIHSWVNMHAPFIWRWLYFHGHKLTSWLREPAAKQYANQFLELLKQVEPDLVITTQVSPSAVMQVLKKSGQWKGKWAIAFSDYHFHPYWQFSMADSYIVNINLQKQILQKMGIAPQQIIVGGMWLPPRAEVVRSQALFKLGLNENDRVILVSAGSTAWLNFDPVISALTGTIKLAEKQGIIVRPIIVCGKNEHLKNKLQKQGGKNWIILGWVEDMQTLYAISSLYITKPGGLSIAESLQWNLPCFIPFTLPGQEELNIRFLEKRGLIVNLAKIWHGNWPELIVRELQSSAMRQHLASEHKSEETIGSHSAGKIANMLHFLFHEGEKSV